ncbi:DUF4397 domain-containing protein [Chitinophaga sp. Mgbs1]|uniref:DUF4397 domain-containing protein n=1 Tax=Chitinophaga solisilvae TaxID=1233460 RepID=A0A9Q5GV72_9BACT|nr:DUF4397 domain-containing protein [Chitinophaga solisilvae]
MMNRLRYYVLCLMGAAGLVSCTKKMDFTYDNRINPGADAASSVRIVNLRGATELQIGEQQLTTFLRPNREGNYDETTTRGNRYFPENGRLGTTYTIPQSFVGADGIVRDIRMAGMGKSWSLALTRPFQMKDDFNNPTDYYYTFYGNPNAYKDSVFAVPRSVSSPANPERFKIRLLNLSSPGYRQEGPMTVTLADGTPVKGLENIAPDTYSDYVELPYGTYQFRVLDAKGNQLPGVGGSIQGLDIIDKDKSTIMMSAYELGADYSGYLNSGLTFANIKTYQPGGVYTIAVADLPNFKNLTNPGTGETSIAKTNGFRVINDFEPVNNTYARMQSINVMPGRKVKVQADNRPVGPLLAFGKTEDYSIYITGMHTLKLMDEAGNVLAEKTVQLMAADNISVWAYEDKDGKPAMSVVANNLSGVINNGGNGEDGTYTPQRIEYSSWLRFMNFAPDLPEVTFTANDGQPFYNATPSQHLKIGIPDIKAAYIRMNASFITNIMAYASSPDVLPGNWIRSIPVLKSRQFIANPALYKDEQPYSEPGVYTVALAGLIKSDKPEREKATMIIIKHNK